MKKPYGEGDSYHARVRREDALEVGTKEEVRDPRKVGSPYGGIISETRMLVDHCGTGAKR